MLGVVFAGAGQTIGFAIAARLANRVVPALASEGEYEHPYIGVGVDPVGPQVAEANDLEAGGVQVTEVVPNAPADGVLEPATETTTIDGELVRTGGDVILAIGDREIPNQDLLSSTLALETSPGETIEIEIVRDGEPGTVELTLASRPDVDTPEIPDWTVRCGRSVASICAFPSADRDQRRSAGHERQIKGAGL